MKRLLPALVAMLLPLLAGAQAYVTTEADSLLAVKVLQRLERNRSFPTADLVHQAANALMGQTYVANTLNEGEGEQLRIFLTRTDCIIFVETCFALARTAKEGGDFRRFAACVLEGRYRDGVVTRFEDRIHYTTENFRRACRRGTLKDMSRELGGEIFDHPINFMSTHPGSYPLMTDVEAIRKIEEELNSEPSWYIPQDKLEECQKGIRSGDLICFTSTVPGLDIAHVAIASVSNDGTVGFIHASNGEAMKVIYNPTTLLEYVRNRKNVDGVMVFRPL